jgi:small subunit ribosomal protein S17
MTEQLTETQTRQRGIRKVRVGRVVSDKMDKTVIVQVTDSKSHRLYRKVIQRRARFKAHDEQNQCTVGDLVRIMETRPLSREKGWRVVEVVEKAR